MYCKFSYLKSECVHYKLIVSLIEYKIPMPVKRKITKPYNNITPSVKSNAPTNAAKVNKISKMPKHDAHNPQIKKRGAAEIDSQHLLNYL